MPRPAPNRPGSAPEPSSADRAQLMSRIAGARGVLAVDTITSRLTEHHELTLHIEHCTAPRPSRLGTLTGRTEQYTEKLADIQKQLESSDVINNRPIEYVVNKAEVSESQRSDGAVQHRPAPSLPGRDPAEFTPRLGAFEGAARLNHARLSY